jgi:hypothetical protein
MAEPDKRPVTLEELLVSSLAQTDAPAKLLIEKGVNPRRAHAEDFGGTGDVSKAFQSDAAMTIKASPPNGSTNTNEATEGLMRRLGALPFSGLAPGNKPDDNPDYQHHQNYAHPDSGLENISDHLTASQGHSRKK